MSLLTRMLGYCSFSLFLFLHIYICNQLLSESLSEGTNLVTAGCIIRVYPVERFLIKMVP